MSSRWLHFPAPTAIGPLQVMTWVMTSSSSATVSYTGLEIIRDYGASALQYSTDRVRLLVGPGGHSDHTGYTSNAFDTGTNCRLSWNYYSISVTLNGGSSISLNSTSNYGSGSCQQLIGAVRGCCQDSYLNTSTHLGTALASGQTLVFTVTANA